ncbi:hypothetical protein ASPZODRAFT_147035 [Penicilliopsis zonata CBS 506.65]|uniref:Thioesterase domain-containing protein n=1 Tax=Penicilliopsis zonata CBS 506.65 TaxID=1073090 RepID=A0A1L9S6T8_9EURO|nr:hypothetical protein ASPZODRAFT_147035 [Penicilliopsis zonata CBS 506.65]OJJ42869.1 hypothetical protein ASPZODRAFT_147035 [Penicilliopsis zonata CBS 506.65]
MLDLLGSLFTWKAAAIALALLNLKNLPLVWHVRVFRYFFANGWHNPPHFVPKLPASQIFEPASMTSRAPFAEIDYNMHKSNSTYFSDLDVSRTKLMCGLTVKATRILEQQLAKEGKKNGRLAIILGSVYTAFKREIPPYMKYEVRSKVLGWDQKWIYIVTWFVKPARSGKKQTGDGEDFMKKNLLAMSISKYVVKKGRYTVPPKDVFEAAGYGLFENETNGVNGSASGCNFNTQKKSSDSDDIFWSSERLDEERRRGVEVVQPFIDEEDRLVREFLREVTA